MKLAVSGPVVIAQDPYPRSSGTLTTPIRGDFSALTWWRFQRKDFAGKRIESTAVAGLLVPGPQQETGIYRNLNSGPGYMMGAVTGIASRSQYIWVGASYQRYAGSHHDQRPDLFSYTAVYSYRRSPGGPIIHAGTGASSASEPARCNVKALIHQAVRHNNFFSDPASLVPIALSIFPSSEWIE